ncbi:MAG: DUF2330 domain-containing protein [Nannocystaceae bacterium]|nr:DUF2330 domain-containing protein [Nannocystaceae bacterium]
MMKTSLIASLVALTGALVLTTPQEAKACGGTFCDAGPTSMPVDQTGENILFVMGEDYTEAHIQIQYDPSTEASEFSWIVPLTELPEFGVGSELLFDAVLSSSVPRYGFNSVFTGQSCGGEDTADSGGGDPTGPAGGSSGADSGTDTDGGGGVDILLKEVVGAFEITVLSGDNVVEVKEWLETNGYQQDPNADPILEEYLSEGYIFAAFKLTNDTETSEIHPITLRFPNNEACIPLRLTRIAAVDDMDIRSFFLSDDRVVPSTYKHVLVNPLRLDWANLASNYKSVITQAVDADEAAGRAFVTEYAGSSEIVPSGGLYGKEWNSGPFGNLAPIGVVDVLENQGLMTCFEDGGGFGGSSSSGGDSSACQYNHPLLRGLLQKHLPVPEGIDEVDFYGCLSCYQDQIDQEAWDSAGFAADLESRIVVPGQRAVELLGSFPYLTRMYTTMSPGEMTVDPFFYENPDLGDIDLTAQFAQQGTGCDSSVIWTLPDDRVVYSPDGSWPDFSDEMPWEEEVAEMMQAGAPMVLVNRTETINTQLSMHNCQYDYPSTEACGGIGGDTDGPGGTDSGSESGSDSIGGTDSAGQDTQLDDDGGCNCSAANDTGGATAFMLGLFGLMGLRRRR